MRVDYWRIATGLVPVVLALGCATGELDNFGPLPMTGYVGAGSDDDDGADVQVDDDDDADGFDDGLDDDGKDDDAADEDPRDDEDTGDPSDSGGDGHDGADTGGDDTDSGSEPGPGPEFDCADIDITDMSTPVSYSGDNSSGSDTRLGSCTPGGDGADVAIVWTAPEAGSYTIDTQDSAIDTVLFVLDACDGIELACNDDIDLEELNFQSELTVDLDAGQSILIVVDGYDEEANGSFELHITAS